MFPTDNDFESKFTFETEANPIDEESPFHILLLGNWSGNFSENDISKTRPMVVDRDNFEELMRRLNVRLELDLHGDGENLMALTFTELDDFHPDNLYRQLSVFSDLRSLRSRLLKSDSFEQAAGEVRSWFKIPETEHAESFENQDPSTNVSSENLLDAILSQPSESGSALKPRRSDKTELGLLISQIVSPYLIKVDESEQSKLVAAVDEATSELMRTILHHPKFQELEASWRGLYFLIRRVETDSDLKVFICDVSKEKLTDNIKQSNNLADTDLYRLLIRETIETPGGIAWALICGNYTFGVNVDDIAALMRLATLSSAAEAPFISYMQPQIFGIQSFAESSKLSNFKFMETSTEGKLWSTLREVSESEYLGLLPTRLLVRLPYGDVTDSIESFSFEEFTGEIPHQNYLWMNPCFAVAFLMAHSFRTFGWEIGRNLFRDLEGLPMHVYKHNGETIIKPCAEIVLTENQSEVMLEQGMMPLISFRNSDNVRLKRLQSISEPLKALAGRWND